MNTAVYKNPAVEMAEAKTYAQWKRAAIRYDKQHGLDRWRKTEQTPLYDHAAIRMRLEALRELRESRDNHGLLYALNEGIHGNMGGMGSAALYRRAKFGTKQLVVDYTDEIVSALEHLADNRVRSIPLEEKVDFFQRASHCFGRSALLLSGAGTLLYFHLGVVKALWEEDLLPRIISGSSGGAFVAALVGTHSHHELENIFDPSFLDVEAERDEPLFKYLSVFSQEQIPVSEVREILERLIPDLTFQEAYERTGIHINIPVAPARVHQGSRLLNAITSPTVMVREAVLASSAVPGLYPAVTLAARNAKGKRQPYLPSRKWRDGSLFEDLPLKRISRLYGVNHSIVSQTNPFALPFVREHKDHQGPLDVLSHAALQTAKQWSLAAAKLALRPVRNNDYLNKVVNTYVGVLSQTYTGDINILPPTRVYNPLRLLSRRSKEEILDMIASGERAAWPRIEMIRVQSRISRALDVILERFEKRLLISARKQQAIHDKAS